MTNGAIARAVLALAFAVPAAAGTSSQLINFQGKLLDTSNNPRNGSFNMTFSIYSVPSGGSALWTETQNGVSVNNGAFNVSLGAATPLTTGLFNGTTPYLGVTVSPDSEMTPRQPLLMTPLSFRALLADDLAPGNTSYVQVTASLQAGAVFHVSSATVEGPFQATGASSFTATGAQVYSLNASSGVRVQAGTLEVDGAGGVNALFTIQAATLTASTSLQLPSGAPAQTRGVMRFDPTLNLLYIGTGTANKTMLDTDSVQTETNKTLSSLGGNVVDATMLQTRAVSNAAPANGQVLKWSSVSSNWFPDYANTIASFAPPFTPSSTRALGANTIYVMPITLSGTLTLNQMRFQVTTAAGGVTGDVGVYDVNGNLVAHAGTGAVDFSIAQVVTAAPVGAPISLLPGQYYLAITCNGTPAIRTFNMPAVGLVKGVGTLTGGGTALPNPITPSSIADANTVPYISLNQ